MTADKQKSLKKSHWHQCFIVGCSRKWQIQHMDFVIIEHFGDIGQAQNICDCSCQLKERVAIINRERKVTIESEIVANE